MQCLPIQAAFDRCKPFRVNHQPWENEVKHRRNMLARAAALAIEGGVVACAALALPTAMAADGEGDVTTQRVEITGSAIRRIESEGALPVTVISRDAIDRTFGQGSVEDILAALDAEHTDWAQDTANTIRAKSPTSLKIAFRQIREGKSLSFDECMKMEYRMVNRIVAGHDFYEGVRAVIIDKDNAPKWQPAALSGVSDADVGAYFAPLGEKELKL